MPGIKKYGNVVLKRGVFTNDKALLELYRSEISNAAERQNIIISLHDENKTVAMV